MGIGGVGTGLVSGINYSELIKSLMELEKKPFSALATSVAKQQLKQDAYSTLNGLALSAKLSMFDLASKSTFESKIATSSDETVLSATTTSSAALASYTMEVAQLAQSSQHLSTGVANQDNATLGEGVITLELGGRRMDKSVALSDLNGGSGIRKDLITVKQNNLIRKFDISRAETIKDVVDILNANDLDFEVKVASVDEVPGGSLVGTSLWVTEGGAGAVTFSGDTAGDLGLSSVTGQGAAKQGTQIYWLTTETKLSKINDGFGIRTNASGTNDVRFYVTSGGAQKSVEADLSGAEDIGDVVNALNVAVSAAGLLADAQFSVSKTTNSITNTGTVAGFQDLSGSKAATDLGLVGGDGLVSEMGSFLLRNINGGNGLGGASSDSSVKITLRDATSYTINFAKQYTGYAPKSIHDIIRVINAQSATKIEASLNDDGNGIKITDKSGGSTTAFRVEDVSGDLAKQLGIETTVKVAVAQNNTSGFKLVLTSNELYGLSENDLVGRAVRHKYSSDVVSGDANGGFEVISRVIGYDSANNTLILASAPAEANHGTQAYFDDNTTGDSDVVHIMGVAGTTITGKNLEPRMMSGSTLLDDLNGGKGIYRGKISVSMASTSSSSSAEIDLSDTDIQTVQNLIDEIAANISGVVIEVNEKGDGLRAYNTTTSENSTLSITDLDNGTTAADLNLATSAITQSNISFTSGKGDFYSVLGTDSASAGTYGKSITSSSFYNLDRDDVIGSVVRYASMDNNGVYNGETVFGMISEYSSNSTAKTGTITVMGTTYAHSQGGGFTDLSDSFLGTVDTDIANLATVGIIYKKDLAAPVKIGAVTNVDSAWAQNPGAAGPNGSGQITVNPTSYSNLSQTELVGNLIMIMDSATKTRIGKTAMVYAVANNAGNAQLSYVSADQFDIGVNDTIAIMRSRGATDAVRNTKFLSEVADGGFYSLIAKVDSATSTTITSDNFDGMDPRKLIGALVTVANTSDSTSVGNYAVITDYSDSTDTITMSGGFYDSSGTTATVSLAENDLVAITYKDGLKGAVIRSTMSDITGLSIAATATKYDATVLKNAFVANVVNNSAIGGSLDTLIGATVQYTGAAASGEKRKIVDVIEAYDGTTGNDLIVLDKDFSATPVAAQTFTLSFPTITATIKEVDFTNKLIRTTEDMAAGMGYRDFTICGVKDGTYQKDVAVLSTDTLNDVVLNINNAKAGVKASVLNDGSATNPYKLSLISERTGEAGAIAASSTVPGFSFTRTSAAKDSRLVLGDSSNSTVVTNSTNTISTILAGVTIKLTKASTSKITLSIDHDTEGILEKAKAFYESFNTAMSGVNKLTALENEVEVTDENGNKNIEKQKGVLFGDSTALNMQYILQNIVLKKVSGVTSGSFQTLFDIGFSFDAKGELLEFSESSFKTALLNKFEQVQNLLLMTPNIASSASLGASSELLEDGYTLDDIRNGKTSSSGFSESGNGTNGVKIKAGKTGKYLTYSLGETKTLYGTRLYHSFPENTTATKSLPVVNQASASTLSLSAATGVDVLVNTGSYISSLGLDSSDVIGATLTVKDKNGNSYSSTITGFEHFDYTTSTADEDRFTLADTTVSTALAGAGQAITAVGYTIQSSTLSTQDELDIITNAVQLDEAEDLDTTHIIKADVSATSIKNNEYTSKVKAYDAATSKVTLLDDDISTGLAADNTLSLREAYTLDSSGATDVISDVTNLASYAPTSLIGAIVKVTKSGVTYASTITGYNSSTKQITLGDKSISTGIGAVDLFDYGYKIQKVSNLVNTAGSGTLSDTGASDELADAANLNGLSSSSVVGATVRVTRAGVTYANTVTAYSDVTDTITLADDSITANSGGSPYNNPPYVLSTTTDVLTVAANPFSISSDASYDYITDATNLVGMNSTEIKGSVVKVVIGGTTYSSVVTDYSSSTKKITLANKIISAAIGGNDLEDYGYTLTKDSGQVNYSISKAIDTKYNPTLEYLDSNTGDWKEYRRFENVTNERSYVVFPNGLKTSALRINYRDNSGDEDFTSSTQYARLMEWEVLEAKGLGSQINRDMDGITNSQTGLFATATSGVKSMISTLNDQMSSLENRLASKEELLVKQFENLELAIATLNSQSSFLTSQLNSLPKAFSHRK